MKTTKTVRIERTVVKKGDVTTITETITSSDDLFAEDVERMRRDAARPSGSFFHDFFKNTIGHSLAKDFFKDWE